MPAFLETDYDLAIIGAGMSGLSLAAHLSEAAQRSSTALPKTIVIDPRTDYSADKTWCYWQTEPTLFEPAIKNRWERWRVSANGASHISEHPHMQYVRVDSGAYYQTARDLIAQSEQVHLRLGQTVQRVRDGSNQLSLGTSEQQYAVDFALDTRPRAIPTDTLLQHFVGWEITTESDCFDPGVVTLMDFMPSHGYDIHFFYVLPYGPRHALVETTHFSMSLETPEHYAHEIETYLSRNLGLTRWQVVRREQGIIPMAKHPRPARTDPASRIRNFGLHGDTVKPSSGYCYLQAQRQAAAFSANLQNEYWMHDSKPSHGQLAAAMPQPRNAIARWFDGVFVNFLERQPQRAPEIFLALFSRVDPACLVRFLSDQAGPHDYLQVMTALPKTTFLREAADYARSA